MTPTFKGRIKEGKLGVYAKQEFGLWIGSLEGQEINITIKKFRNNRSTKQNSYYWVVLTHAGSELGYDPEELHATFKAMFNCDRTKQTPIVRSTRRLDSKQFTEYLDKIIRKLAEMNIIAPDPSEYYNNIKWN
jgi:hypothetical protein